MAHNSNVLYVEPNYVWDNNQIGNTSEYKEVLPDLEDMCVVIDLEVEIPSKTYNVTQSSDNAVYGFQWTVPNNGKKPQVSFFQGTKYVYQDSKGKSFMSTNAYDFATYEDVLKITQSNNGMSCNSTNELFGINSVDIEYNNYMVPIVTIKFTDIRGVSLFAPEEIRHSSVKDAMDGTVNNDVAGSFFKAFFTFPYPKFKLMVKGIYGEPVAYELTCADFRANFESQSGNFAATAKFVGYSYSLLSDVTLTSLLAAPLSTYHGKKYWVNKQNVAYEEGGFVFSDGTPMEPLTEVLQKYESVASELATYTNASPDAENIKKGDANLTLLTQIRERFYHYVYEVVSQDKIRNNVYYDNNAHYSTCFIITCNDYDDYINSDNYITLNSLLEDANLGLTLPQIAKITSKNKLNAKEYSSQFITVYNTVINEQPSWETINLLDGGNFIVKLDELIKKQTAELKSLNDRFIQSQQDTIQKILGFIPSVENITRITLAHLETLLSCFDVCEQEANNQSRSPIDLGLSGEDLAMLGDGASSSRIGLFPECTFGRKDYNGTITREYDWLGTKNRNAAEVNFIEGLLSGIKNVNDDVELASEAMEQLSMRQSVIGTPIHPLDLFCSTNPFFTYRFNPTKNGGLEDIAARLGARMTLLLSDTFGEKNVSKIGEIDGQNFMSAYPYMNTIDREFINSVNVNDLMNALIKKTWGEGEQKESFFNIDGDKFVPQYMVKMFGGTSDNYITKLLTCSFIPVNSYEWSNIQYVKNDNDGQWRRHFASNYLTLDDTYYTKNACCPYVMQIIENASKYDEFSSNLGFETLKTQKLQGVKGVANFHASNNPLDADDTVLYNVWDAVDYTTSGDIIYNISHRVKATSQTMVIERNGKGKDLKNNQTLNNTLNYEDLMINQIPSVISNLFTLNSIEIKGLLYLNDFDQCDVIEKLLRNNQDSVSAFNKVTKYGVLWLGGILWYLEGINENVRTKELDDIFNKSYVNADEMMSDALARGNSTANSGSLRSPQVFHPFELVTSLNMRQDIKDIFVAKFLEWVRGDFENRIYNELKIVEDGEIKKLDAFKTVLTAAATSKRDITTIVQDIKNALGVETQGCKNVFYNYLSADYDGKAYNIWLREGTQVMNQIINDLNTNWLVIIPLRRYNSKRIAIKQDMCKAYLTSFLKSVNKISSDRLRTESNQPSTNHEVTHDVKIALYRYLKVLWDKWLSGNPLRTTKWGLKEFTKHWYFLDSYYNRIGDKTYLNVQSLAEDLKATLNTQGYNMLNFLFTSYGRNKMGLYCVQNFLGMLDKEKMEHMFKPMPYSQIDTSKIDEIPDFIVMQTGEFSSKLNIPGAEYADDSFMIATEDIPESIKTKKSILSDANGDGYPIPAFGVTIGKQYQSYFTDVRIAMDSPIVTEQSLRAQFALASANSGQKDSGESKNEVKMLGQDLYTIYSNNSYTCDVQMLGCAWIQPLMYFQLNNVPMYRGTYLVQKVSHHIAPGQMVTTFKGTRMSRLKTPMVKLYYETSKPEQTTPASERLQSATDKPQTGAHNNCGYYYFEPKTENTNSKSDMIEALIVALNQTIKKIDEDVEVEALLSMNNMYDIVLKKRGATISSLMMKHRYTELPIKLSQIFDILVTTYNNYISKCLWIVGDSNTSEPSLIKIEINGNVNNPIYAICNQSYIPISFNQNDIKEGINSSFCNTLKKRYGVIDGSNIDLFKKQCTNFQNISQEEINTLLGNASSGNTAVCSSSLNDDTYYSWKGYTKIESEKARDAMAPKPYNLSGQYDFEKVKEFLKNYKKGPTNQCALAVRLALAEGGIKPDVYPVSACVYNKHLHHWGFTLVHQCYHKQPDDYIPQNGDIEVVASCPNHKYGHIAMYIDGKWYSDEPLNNLNPYSRNDKGGRPIHIWRYLG